MRGFFPFDKLRVRMTSKSGARAANRAANYNCYINDDLALPLLRLFGGEGYRAAGLGGAAGGVEDADYGDVGVE